MNSRKIVIPGRRKKPYHMFMTIVAAPVREYTLQVTRFLLLVTRHRCSRSNRFHFIVGM